jgi:hypothetical protein
MQGMTRRTEPIRPIHPTHLTGRRLVAGIGLLLAPVLVAACGGSDSGSGAGASEMSLTVTAPRDGAAVGRSFPVDVRSNVPFGEPSTGRHHLHLYFDGNKNEGEYDIVYGKHTTVTDLSPGRHTIEAEIANPDHSGTGVTRDFSVTVGGAGGSGTSRPTTPTTNAPDLGY